MSEKESSFHSFIQLVAVDEKIRILKQKIATLKEAIIVCNTQKKQYDLELEKAHAAVVTAKKEVDALELIMKELDALEATKKTQLDNVSGFKDYQSLQQELNHVQAKQQSQEQAVLKAWSVYESAQEAFVAAQKNHAEKSGVIAHEIAQKNSALQELEKAVLELDADRPAYTNKVSSDWLDLYAHMSGHVADPVVPIVQESCGSCFHVLTRQELLHAQRGQLVQCKGCFRLLYLEQGMVGVN